MYHKLFYLSVVLILISGCSESPSQSTAKQPTNTPATNTPAANKEAPKPVPAPPPPPPAATVVVNKQPVAQPPRNTEPESPKPAVGNTLEKADVGSGEKGRGYGQGVIATNAAAYFAAKERILFTITIPDIIRAYKFEHDFKGPKSHDEFMALLNKHGIKLITLPQGHKYVYDPKTEQLMVERPQ